MESLLHIFILLPIAGFLISLLLPAKKENWLSSAAFITVGLHLLAAIVYIAYWAVNKHKPLNLKDIVVFKTDVT